MEIKNLIYAKKHSIIQNIQAESCTDYYLVQNDSKFNIELLYKSNNITLEQKSKYFFDSELKARQVITFLYENSIKIENFDDIILELLDKV